MLADSTGRYTATFDAVGQIMVTASPNNQRQTFSYDTVGLRRSMDATGAGRFTYLYDAANQISSLRNPYSERTTFGYDDAGRRNVQRNANGTRVSLSYAAASQTTQVFHRTSAGASVLQLDYRYDNAGNRKSMAENATAARTTWTYDKQNQLVGEYRTGTNPYRQTFTYDSAGNRTLKNIDTVRTTYAYDVANQLRYAQAVAGRTSFAYDTNGNQRVEQPPTGNRTTTTWNFENQPTQYRLPIGSPVTMTYNGDNRRVISQQGATSNKFVWDATTDAYLSELDGTNAVQAVYTNEPQHFGSVVSQRRSSTSHWLHADALGTTRLLTSSTQTTSDTYLLDAWGNPITSSGTTVNPFRWVGRYGYYQDASTGLVYVRARMYYPTTARWSSLDPLTFIDGINRYTYVKNNILVLLDPSGLVIPPQVGAAFLGCGIGGLTSGITTILTNMTESFETVCCKAGCSAAGGCVGGAIVGVIATTPGLSAWGSWLTGCVAGIIGDLVKQGCEETFGCGDGMGMCDAWNLFAGCLAGGTGAAFGESGGKLAIIGTLIGIDYGLWSNLCSNAPGGGGPPVGNSACCGFDVGWFGTHLVYETVPCPMGVSAETCCENAADGTFYNYHLLSSRSGKCKGE